MTLRNTTRSRPWWDKVEETLLYGIVLLATLTLPTSLIFGHHLVCEPGGANHKGTTEQNKTDSESEDYINEYCTANAVEAFIRYLPFMLLGMAIILVFIERAIITIFSSGDKLERLNRDGLNNLNQELYI